MSNFLLEESVGKDKAALAKFGREEMRALDEEAEELRKAEKQRLSTIHQLEAIKAKLSKTVS